MTIKRLLDLTGALCALPVLGIIIIPVALAIRWDSPGPIFFLQTRVGRNERPFTLIKFRTMRANMDNRASHEANQSMITYVGRVLRRSKIDELPQIWNVFAGDMSLVGPRPCLLSQDELIQLRRQRGVFDCKPGITGLAQLNEVDMSQPEKLSKLDAEYCRSRSNFNDLLIIIKTLAGKGRGDAVVSVK
jgi:O-antigen biosynthesis protein WbqP